MTSMKERYKRVGLSVGLSLACLLIGYGFYSMNHRDWINGSVFGLGLLGILLSVLRRPKERATPTAPRPDAAGHSGSEADSLATSPDLPAPEAAKPEHR